MSDDYAGPGVPTFGSPIIACGRSYRHEVHDSHVWRLQPEDDSPAEIDAACPGSKAVRS